MKHFFYWLLAILPLCAPISAQNNDLQRFIDAHQKDPGFSYAFLSKDLFDIAIQSDHNREEWQGLHNVIKNIGSLRILAADSIENARSLFREVRGLVAEAAFDELLTVRDGNENVRIWTQSEENRITNLVLLIGSPHEFVLVCFAGNLELNNLSELADLFESGKTERLAKSTAALTQEFSVSPNPSSGDITLKYPDDQDLPVQINVIDAKGASLMRIQASESASQNISLGHLPTGTYWIQIITRQGKIGIKPIQILNH